jgi:hypothetical protein
MQDEFRTGAFDVVANDTTTAIFNAMTGAISTTDMKDVRFAVWLSGLGLLKVKIGVQFSNDGISWDSPATVAIAGGFATAIGWTFDTAFTDLTAVAGTTHRLFVRFGVMAVTTSGTASEGGQAELSVQVKPKAGTTITVGPVRAWCTGSTSTFIPMTGWISAEDIGEIRGSVEMLATSGDLGVKCAWRQANKPTDTSDWSSSTSFGTEATSNTIQYGTTFSTPASVTKKYIQFGVDTRNTLPASVIEACQATIRIDYRNL